MPINQGQSIKQSYEAIGNQAEENSPESYPNVKVNEQKLVIVDQKTGETLVKGIFAGGDIVRGPSLVVKAVRDGKNAAKAIINHLANEEAPVCQTTK